MALQTVFDEIVVHTQFPWGGFGLRDFLFRDAAFQGRLDGEFQPARLFTTTVSSFV